MIDVSVAAVTVKVVEPVTLSNLAAMVLVPAATPVTKPSEPLAFETVAVAVFDELQLTDVVTSCMVLFANRPIALNCRVVPFAMEGVVGVTNRATGWVLLKLNGLTMREQKVPLNAQIEIFKLPELGLLVLRSLTSAAQISPGLNTPH